MIARTTIAKDVVRATTFPRAGVARRYLAFLAQGNLERPDRRTWLRMPAHTHGFAD